MKYPENIYFKRFVVPFSKSDDNCLFLKIQVLGAYSTMTTLDCFTFL